MGTREQIYKENAAVELHTISKLVQDIYRKVVQGKVRAKECPEFILLKEKCCDKNALVSLSAFHGIKYLVDKKILISSQTISMLVSLLPSIKQFGGMVYTIGNILLSDFKSQITENEDYKWSQVMQFQHPFLVVLKSNWDKSWFEVHNFILELMKINEDMSWEHKIQFMRPIYRQIFWSSSHQGSQLQLKLFNTLMMEFHEKKIMDFALETLLWQELNIYFCSFLQEFFIYLLKKRQEEAEVIAFGLTPLLAVTTKWLILNGYNPNKWLKILGTCVERNMASGSAVLFILTDVVMETPSMYISQLVDVCKSIIFNKSCSKYVAHKFAAGVLNWLMNPSFLANQIYKTLEKTLEFMTWGKLKWNDQTPKLSENEYYRKYGSSKKEAKFAVDLIEVSNSWGDEEASIKDWLENFKNSDKLQMQFRVCSFIQGILLCEKDKTINNLCLEILFKLIEQRKEISFSVLCLLFYKLGKEMDPEMQKIYLFSIPKLSVKKENIPVIVGIIEALKRDHQGLMNPIVIQLFLSLWKFDNRTYSCLHNMLHFKTNDNLWELNVSKVIALREICRLAPHLHAKDLVGVLSQILNESSGNVSGLPSAIAIEAVTLLCKAYVIDVAGTWNAIQPKLRFDKRPQVIESLCRFFGEIPTLNTSYENASLTNEIVPMLWDYTFSENSEVVKSAWRALSNFPVENLQLRMLPQIYRDSVKLPKDFENIYGNVTDILTLPYIPAECWILFLEKVKKELLQDAGGFMMVLLERDLISLPRGIFYLPLEKPEPLNYSYLPQRSICRALLDRLLKYSKGTSPSTPEYVREIIRILAHEYSKILPPLNWEFLRILMVKDWEFSRYCLPLLVKQASVSSSARAIIENHFKFAEWNCNKFEEIILFYNLMPLLCKAVSYSILQNFLEQTIKLCLENTLKEKGPYFEEIVESLTKALRSKIIQPGHKNLISKQIEKVLNLIPPDHKIMEKYATLATEFPVKLIEEITSPKNPVEVDSDWLRRAIAIRNAIAMRSDINSPLIWLNEFTEAVADHPEKQHYVLNAIRFVIQNRKDCDHRPWVHEFIVRTQTRIKDSESTKASLFFVDVFITAAIILSGYDCLFVNVDELINSKSKKLKIFPQALTDLLSSPDWSDMLPKVRLWLQNLSKWKNLPQDHVIVFIETLLMLREVKSFGKENEFSMFAYPLRV